MKQFLSVRSESEGFQLILILGLLGVYFDGVMVDITRGFAVAIL